MDLSDLRIRHQGSLQQGGSFESPFDQFEKWFAQALEAQLEEPNAMSSHGIASR